MIISYNRKPTNTEFESLIAKATNVLNTEAKRNSAYFLTRTAQKLEDDVVVALNKAAVGSPFEGSIQKISGQYFPDIIVGRYFGIEVKSSKDEHWTTLGGSINESTRIQDIERIFLTFGKLTTPVEFISRPYQDCLSDIVVTHYPRYKINMKLEPGETIFDKMNIAYDDLRQKDNPVKDVILYYKRLLKSGERLWWLDLGNDEAPNEIVASTSARVRLWKTLSSEEKQNFIINAYTLFPEIVGNAPDKYDNFSLWLVSNYGIVSTSMRDSFSAGGRVKVSIRNQIYDLSRTVYNLYLNKDIIKHKLASIPELVLKDLWKVPAIHPDRFGQWLAIVTSINPECGCLA
ncbi:MAG: hypothetical protein J6J82_03865 [Alphaproteobacteria bacterium]|nr:hypothetical protein [Alphaproteobacteria bacterium]